MATAEGLSLTHCLACGMRGSRSFCSLSAQALEHLDRLGSTLRVQPRGVILREGGSPGKVYILCEGRVKLTVSSAEGRLLILRVAGPGDVLGLASLLSGSRSRTSVEALEDCTIKAIPRDDFLNFVESFSDVRHNTSMTMAREYDAALLSARRLALSTSAASKLATALLDLAHMAHPPEAAPKPSTAKPIASQPLDFSLPLTHEEIGCMTGISRETVTRLLGKFRREHLLQQNGEHVTLTDPTRLDSLYCV